jgi:hypothetical protein
LSLPIHFQSRYIRPGVVAGEIEVLPLFEHTVEIEGRQKEVLLAR